MNRSIAAGLAAALTTLGAVTASAQEPDAEAALEMTRAILAFYPFSAGAQPELLVGALPDDVAAAFEPPADAKPLGGIIHDRASIGVFAVPDGRRALAAMEARLEARGHRRHTATGIGFHGGFIMPDFFCLDDSTTAGAGSTTGRSDHDYLVLVLSTDEDTGCDQGRRGDTTRPAPIPDLDPPAGARLRGGGTSGGNGVHTAYMSLDSGLDARELVEHYAPQMRAAGWEVGEILGDEGAAMATIRWADDEGGAWSGLLSAIVAPTGAKRTVAVQVGWGG